MASELGAAVLPVAFLGIAALGVGYFTPARAKHAWRIAGWLALGTYWPFQAPGYFAEPNPTNAWFALLSPLLFGYIAYHEWRSRAWEEDPPVLKWLTGTTAIAMGTYFLIYEIPVVTNALIAFTTWQSVLLLRHGFGVDVGMEKSTWGGGTNWDITLGGAGEYAVTVVLACTALQSIMIFVGAIATAPGLDRRRRWRAYALVIPLIWIGNLLRIAAITVWFKVWDLPTWFSRAWATVGVEVGALDSAARFEFMHVIIGKGGSLLLLVVLAIWLFRALPEVHGLVLDVFDLRKRHAARFYTRDAHGPSVASRATTGEVR